MDKKEKDGEDGDNDETAWMKMPLLLIQQFLKQETSSIVDGSLQEAIKRSAVVHQFPCALNDAVPPVDLWAYLPCDLKDQNKLESQQRMQCLVDSCRKCTSSSSFLFVQDHISSLCYLVTDAIPIVSKERRRKKWKVINFLTCISSLFCWMNSKNVDYLSFLR
jgi:hypothetical protein